MSRRPIPPLSPAEYARYEAALTLYMADCRRLFGPLLKTGSSGHASPYHRIIPFGRRRLHLCCGLQSSVHPPGTLCFGTRPAFLPPGLRSVVEAYLQVDVVD